MEIKREDLLKALTIVKPGLSNKEIIEQSTSFAFMGDKIVTYNDEISISHPIEGLDLTGAIKADELYKLLSKLKTDTISIEVVDNKEVVLKSGKSKAGFTLHTEIKLPVEEIGKIGKWKTLPKDFVRLLALCIPSCSTDMSNPKLTCIHVNSDGFMESSDNFCAIRCQLESELPIDTFLIPGTSAKEVVRLPITKVFKGSSWIHFKTEEGTVISCRIYENEDYPNTKKIFDVSGEDFSFPKKIKEILDKAIIFCEKEYEHDETVSISIDGPKMLVKSKSETGWFKEPLKVDYDNNPISFDITPRLLKWVLDQTMDCVIGSDRLKFLGDDWQYVSILKN